jgi:hypothetical protein
MSPSPTLVFFVLSVFQKPNAQATVFIPNCTSPQIGTNFVAAPNTRGTLSILWNCLSIIILCTWNIQHLNIPSRRPYSDPSGNKHGWLRRLWWGIVDTATVLRWMALTIIMPEYIMGRALSERLAAVSSLMSLRSQFGEEMEMVHAYVMNMGGYYLDFTELQFFGVEVSKINGSGSTGLSSTLVDYSGAHFSGHQVDSHPRLHQGSAKAPRKIGKNCLATSSSSRSTKNNKISIAEEAIAEIGEDSIERTCKLVCEAKTHAEEFSAPASPCPSRQLQSPQEPVRSQSGPDPQHVTRSSVQKTTPNSLSVFQRLNLLRFNHEAWPLTALQLLSAKGFKLYRDLPPVSPQDLEALSKSDSLVKFLTILQISWLIIQLIIRYHNKLISSQLEIATLSFSVCSMITYAILWDRPRGLTTRYRVKATRIPKDDEIISLATFGPGYLWTWHRFPGREDEGLHLMPIPNDASHAVDVRYLFSGHENTAVLKTLVEWLRYNHPAVVSVIVGSVLGGTIFGGLHCLAWNFSFPTHTELVLWRTCSILTTILPPLSVYFNIQWSYYNGWAEPEEGTTARRFHGPILLVCFIIPYILARVFLLFEIFWTLFFLPPDAFVDTWPGVFLVWG